ncbi:MAG: UDP-N-acetylglucosamine 1-carboxyvinyltransferase [Patescibacteria group bacterium]
MSYYQITGGTPLTGTVTISGAKNAALPMIAAALLANGPVTLNQVPDIEDIKVISQIITELGGTITRKDDALIIDGTTINNHVISPELINKLRGAVLLLAPILFRLQRVSFQFPGGCVIGDRPIDIHIDALKALGARVDQDQDTFNLEATSLIGNQITLREMSVTGTATAIIAATTATGTSTIQLAAFEPEIIALQDLLQAMGVKIKRINSTTIEVTGTTQFNPTTFTVIPDRIEAATYAAAAIATKGNLLIRGYTVDHLTLVTTKFRQLGANIEIIDPTTIRVTTSPKALIPVNIQTNIYPNFPTDLQPVWGTLALFVEGETTIFEIMYNSRLGYLQELAKMGAKFDILNPHQAKIYGSHPLKPAHLSAPDIRGGIALVVAALATPGTTTIDQNYFIDRGYEQLEAKLKSIGANITKVE